jgi:hypothetical protein
VAWYREAVAWYREAVAWYHEAVPRKTRPCHGKKLVPSWTRTFCVPLHSLPERYFMIAEKFEKLILARLVDFGI